MTDPLELAKKLHALAERGVGGEAMNAGTALKRLLKKHGITMEEVASDHVRDRVFNFKNVEHLRFVNQVIASVLGRVDVYRWKGKKVLVVACTTAQHLEIYEKVEHYWALWLEEVDVFHSAFIQANKLYTKRNPKESDGPDEPLTSDQLEHLRRVREMMSTVRAESPTRRLERGEKLTA